MAPDASALLAGERAILAAAIDAAGQGHWRRAVELYGPLKAAALLDAAEALTAALGRHREYFTDDHGVTRCGGCLEPGPCKDDPETILAAALSGEGAGREARAREFVDRILAVNAEHGVTGPGAVTRGEAVRVAAEMCSRLPVTIPEAREQLEEGGKHG